MGLKQKLTSRKFWLTLISAGTGIAQIFAGDGNAVNTVSGALLALVPAVIYIITEGKIDAAGAKQLASAVSDAAAVISGESAEKAGVLSESSTEITVSHLSGDDTKTVDDIKAV